ncbi:MAG TPA: hypothetical protein VGE39_17685 [Prosthecobacter sp.]
MELNSGGILRAAGIGGFVFTFLLGMFVSVAIVAERAGCTGAVAAILLAPFTFLLVPWYALLFLGEWMPFLLNYCAGSISLFLLAAGKAMLRAPNP